MSQQQQINDIYLKAWGKPWPNQGQHTITHADSDYTAADSEVGQNSSNLTWSYICLGDISSICMACNVPFALEDVLVVREEYVWLRETLQLEPVKRSVLMTGQPGIGKTTFLIYLLLYRLERKLGTAIQFTPDEYILFNANGARVCRAGDAESCRPPQDYWLLCDGNELVRTPCAGFQASRARIIYASSPRPDKWKEFVKQHRVKIIVTALPKPIEIVAIANELKLDPSAAASLVRKWGPCTRTILNILQGEQENEENVYEALAVNGANAICRDPTLVFSIYSLGRDQEQSSEGFTIAFIRPSRARVPDPNPATGDGHISHTMHFTSSIPTAYLAEIFDAACKKASKENAMVLPGPLDTQLRLSIV